jgi:hypothetical protein
MSGVPPIGAVKRIGKKWVWPLSEDGRLTGVERSEVSSWSCLGYTLQILPRMDLIVHGGSWLRSLDAGVTFLAVP